RKWMAYSATISARRNAAGSRVSALRITSRLGSPSFHDENCQGFRQTVCQSVPHHPGRSTRSRITAATPSMSSRHSPRASPQIVRATTSTLGSMGTVSPPLIVALILPPHLVVIETVRFSDDDGEEVDGALQLFDGGLKPCQDVPRYSGGEARVDDPLVLLHRPDPTWRWRFWARKRRSLPTSF